MLKRRCRLIYKKCECQLRDIKYMIMASVFLHNQWISMNDPCKPIRSLSVEQFELLDVETSRIDNRQSKQRSSETFDVVCNWLWNNH